MILVGNEYSPVLKLGEPGPLLAPFWQWSPNRWRNIEVIEKDLREKGRKRMNLELASAAVFGNPGDSPVTGWMSAALSRVLGVQRGCGSCRHF